MSLPGQRSLYINRVTFAPQMSYLASLCALLACYSAYRLHRLYHGCVGLTRTARVVQTTDLETPGACLLEPRHGVEATVPPATVKVDPR